MRPLTAPCRPNRLFARRLIPHGLVPNGLFALCLVAALCALTAPAHAHPPGDTSPQAVPPAPAPAPPPPAQPPRYFTLEHAGSLGLIVGVFGNYESIERADCLTCETTEVLTGMGAALDIGASLGVGWEGAELTLRLRLTRLGPASGEAILAGFRSYFGRDEWKTYASFELAGHIRPIAAGGARAGFGVAWDFSPIFGLWAEAAAAFAFGKGRLFGAQVGLGLQARTYLF